MHKSEFWVEFDSRPGKDGSVRARKLYQSEPKDPFGLVIQFSCVWPEALFMPMVATLDIPEDAVKQPEVQVYVSNEEGDPIDVDP